jgi:hypothetical protein
MARHGTTTVEVKTACELDGDAGQALAHPVGAAPRSIEVVTSFLFACPARSRGVAGHEWVASTCFPRSCAAVASLRIWRLRPRPAPVLRPLPVGGAAARIRLQDSADGADPASALALAARHGAAVSIISSMPPSARPGSAAQASHHASAGHHSVAARQLPRADRRRCGGGAGQPIRTLHGAQYAGGGCCTAGGWE